MLIEAMSLAREFPDVSIEVLLPDFDRKKLSIEIKDFGKLLLDEKLKEIKLQYICIKRDTESFQNLGKDLTYYFKQHGMILACYVTDGCLAQPMCMSSQLEFFDSVKYLHLFAMALELQRGLISFYESDFALAADILIMTYQALQYLNDLILNFAEFQSCDWRQVVECLGENLSQSICKGNTGAHYALAYSLTPTGALSLSKGNQLLGLDLPPCPERDQIPQLLHYCQTSDMLYNKKLQFVEGLAA
ncbi:MAG: hypothetical protein EZS28_051457, partial [Streblomastix strix]